MAALAAFYLWGLTGLPGFGNYPGPYGDIINRIAVSQTHATGVVSAVNFEYRGFDTVGEEFVFSSSPPRASAWCCAPCAPSGSARSRRRGPWTGACPLPPTRSAW